MNVLVKSAQQGNAEAFIKLIEQNKQALQRVAAGFFQNEEDAADAIQETIMDAYEHIGRLRKEKYFKTWLIKILINNCNEIYNHNKHYCVTDTISETEKCEQNGNDTEFKELINLLPGNSRLIFQLFYGEQFTTKEIANLLHMNESNVKSKLHRGKLKLKKELQTV